MAARRHPLHAVSRRAEHRDYRRKIVTRRLFRAPPLSRKERRGGMASVDTLPVIPDLPDLPILTSSAAVAKNSRILPDF